MIYSDDRFNFTDFHIMYEINGFTHSRPDKDMTRDYMNVGLLMPKLVRENKSFGGL